MNDYGLPEKYAYITCCMLICFILSNCNEQSKKVKFNERIRKYYYPVSFQKKVYVYDIMSNGNKKTIYEVIWSEIVKGDTLINRECYNSQYKLSDFHQYRLIENGSLFKEFTTYKKETGYPETFNSMIIHDTIIVWPDQSKPIKIKFKNKYRTVLRERYFRGAGKPFITEHETIKTIWYMDNLYLIINDKKTNKITREMVYGKGIGMVREVYHFSGNKKTIKRFRKIMDYNNWKNKVKEIHLHGSFIKRNIYRDE